ncbi:MAG: rhomboid family intramembrane serine protease [Gemmatimonadaceae bacterium]
MTYPSSSDTQDYPRMTPAVQALIAINVAMLFLQWTVGGMIGLRPEVLAYSGEPLRAWWTPVTYMFAHGGLWHLALNMYTLWIFGPRVEHVWGTKRFTWFYLWCGLGGLLAHALFGPDGSALVGASAAVFGVMLAFAWQWPREEVYLFGVLPLRVSVLVAILAGINLLQGVLAPVGVTGSGVAHLAHLGGFAFAFLYLHAPGPGSIERLRQHVSSVPDGAESPRAIPPRTARSRTRVDEVDEIVAKSKAIVGKQKQQRQPARGMLPRLSGEVKQTEVDRLLDKISAEGMESLTDEERQVLSEFSRRLRGR